MLRESLSPALLGRWSVSHTCRPVNIGCCRAREPGHHIPSQPTISSIHASFARSSRMSTWWESSGALSRCRTSSSDLNQRRRHRRLVPPICTSLTGIRRAAVIFALPSVALPAPPACSMPFVILSRRRAYPLPFNLTQHTTISRCTV
ncbi:hypothetical protein HYPSUDRAFT_46809 [Hypholoma sublateritium FD-334 SS-4]|uniref:Uncharacterized protein n=1 Tax=Hypholoma sublateritium (strain FD-334 SS-4) TaxID=945553 RepID=A0A0D2P9H7_HYPSF|nr:hypothetical protein HYPSUDRAFT_46809 [Hypholoma sublateritium FD-334 SS-4]